MKAEYINPFLVTISNVLVEMIPGVTIERGALQKKPTPIETLGCSSLIGVAGEVEGRIVLDMEKATAIKIAGAMNDEEFTVFDSMAASTINELTNMVSGGAITLLNESGLTLDISTPTMFVGIGLKLFDSGEADECIIIPIHTNFGDVHLNVALKSR
jgi:chemotaxis protein CheX